MPEESIKYSIRQDGKVTQEVFNVPGDVCLNLTEDLEIKLGDLEQRVFTSDYYKQPNLNEDYLAQPIENFWKNKTDVTLQHNQNKNQEQA